MNCLARKLLLGYYYEYCHEGYAGQNVLDVPRRAGGACLASFFPDMRISI